LPSLQTDKFVRIRAKEGLAKKGLHIELSAEKNRYSKLKERNPGIHLFDTVKHYVVTENFKPLPRITGARSGLSIIYVIDSSGSMVQDRQVSYIKGLIESGIDRQHFLHVKYAAVALSHGKARTVSLLTENHKQFLEKIKDIPSGGKTNMTEALEHVYQIVKKKEQKYQQYQLYIFSDGRINEGGSDPFSGAVAYYKRFLKMLDSVFVVDTERGFVRLQLARKFADAIRAVYISLPQE
jgi:magnesium chelatase subunit ChlD-like protein